MKLTKTWHKIVAVALAAVLLLSIIPIAQLVIAASTKTVYFQNNWLWTDVRIHYWGGSSTSGDWPGAAMTKVDTYGGYDIYSAEIPADTTGIIFNGVKNDGSGSRDQTPNIEGTSNIKTDGCYYMSWNNGNQALFDTNYTPPTEETDPPETTAAPTTPSEPDEEEWIIFLKTNSNWDDASAVSIVHYWATGASGTTVTMQETGEANLYYATIPANCTNVLFARANPSDGTWWNQTANLTVPNNYAVFTITSTDMRNPTGSWSTYTGSFAPPEVLEDFYVNTDIVDYLNDNRVTNSQVKGYYTDNQSHADTGSYPTFKYLNEAISGQGYTYPLYFGNLLFVSNRYGSVYGSTTQKGLSNWNTGANVALDGNFSAVVQGLVGDTLDEYGNLTDPKTGEELFYFNKTSADSWKASGSSSKYVMAYYSNLQFPFSTTYNSTTRVTTYSYNSKTDNSVFIDFDSYDDDNETNKMYTSSNSAKDYNGNVGFFPLNKPGDTTNNSSVTNMGFGVKFTIDFTVSKDGTIVADNSETPVEFKFTGDDDVWVFIDGKLVLDMGGAHTMAEGSINFKSLSATVKQAAQVSGVYKTPSHYYNTYGYTGDGEQRESLTVTSNKTTAFPETLAAQFRNEYTTGISQVHTLTMFYMERGGFESNMSIEFSMTPVPSGLTVSKDIANVNPGLNNAIQSVDEFSFQIDATNDGEALTFDGYILTDHNGVSENQTAVSNLITGVRGDRYARAFTSGGLDAFLAGTKYKVTESSSNTVFTYTGTSWKLYDADNSYALLDSGDGSATKELTMAEDKAGNYALNFINTLDSATLTLKKVYNDPEFADQEFTFTVLIDLDGSGSKFTAVDYPGLVYTVDGTSYTSTDGTVKLKANQTATIAGIPKGATYIISEVTSSADAWTADSATGTVGENGAEATITNITKANTVNKVIYVEEGKAVKYTLEEADTITAVGLSDNVKAPNENNVFTVTGTKAGSVDTITYSGRTDNGERITGAITVYTYKATEKVYVFDFGLSSVISATNSNGDGLFQGGIFAIADDNASSTLAIGASSGSQTTITASTSTITESSVPTVTFKPVAFMTQAETYSYTVTILASGYSSVDASDPESGVVITGSITVLPANTVYYEDNFNTSGSSSADKIIFSSGVNVSGTVNRTQSHDQSAHYGYDDAYNSDLSDSHSSATTLTNGKTAYFTFKGTGFDIISRTNANTAGFAVYVVEGSDWNADTLEAQVDKLEAGSSNSVVKTIFVDTYYANGSLVQIPVVAAEMDSYGTYTVYIKALTTMNGVNNIYIDGIRIYDPLGENGSEHYIASEKGANVEELRGLFASGNGVGLAGNRQTSGSKYTFTVGNEETIVENYTGDTYTTATAEELAKIITSGPNNEMYLPADHGIHFQYKITDAGNWTLQLGAKAVSAADTGKSVTIYAKTGSEGYTEVATIQLNTSTDMYYDLAKLLAAKGFNAEDTTYDIVILNSTGTSNTLEFVSLTTVKYSKTVTLS